MLHKGQLKICSSNSLFYYGLASRGLNSLLVCEVMMRIAVKIEKPSKQTFKLQVSSFLILKSTTLGLKHPHKRHIVAFPELIPLRSLPLYI